MTASHSTHSTHSTMTRRQLTSRAGCNIETVRYYEKTGLMPEPRRGANNYRCYDRDHLQRLSFILRARELGFSLDEVRDLLTLIDGGVQTCAEVAALTGRHLADVRKKIADLKQIATALSAMLRQCSEDQVPECAVLEALSRN